VLVETRSQHLLEFLGLKEIDLLVNGNL
jgi:hypothetical protein